MITNLLLLNYKAGPTLGSLLLELHLRVGTYIIVALFVIIIEVTGVIRNAVGDVVESIV